MRVFWAIPVIVSILLVSVFGSAFAADPVFLVQTGDVIDGKTLTAMSDPVMTDNGDIAFFGFFSQDGKNLRGIFTLDSLLVTVGDTIDGRTLTNFLISNPALISINNNGEITFEGSFSGGFGIFTQDRLVVKAGDVVAGEIIKFPGNPLIDDNGDVTFLAALGGGDAPESVGIFREDTLLVKEGDTIDGFLITQLAPPRLIFDR